MHASLDQKQAWAIHDAPQYVEFEAFPVCISAHFPSVPTTHIVASTNYKAIRLTLGHSGARAGRWTVGALHLAPACSEWRRNLQLIRRKAADAVTMVWQHHKDLLVECARCPLNTPDICRPWAGHLTARRPYNLSSVPPLTNAPRQTGWHFQHCFSPTLGLGLPVAVTSTKTWFRPRAPMDTPED